MCFVCLIHEINKFIIFLIPRSDLAGWYWQGWPIMQYEGSSKPFLTDDYSGGRPGMSPSNSCTPPLVIVSLASAVASEASPVSCWAGFHQQNLALFSGVTSPSKPSVSMFDLPCAGLKGVCHLGFYRVMFLTGYRIYTTIVRLRRVPVAQLSDVTHTSSQLEDGDILMYPTEARIGLREMPTLIQILYSKDTR